MTLNQWFPMILLKYRKELQTTNLFIKWQVSRNSSFCQWFWVFLRYNDNLAKASKISELFLISDSRDQCPRYSEIFIYTFLALDGV